MLTNTKSTVLCDEIGIFLNKTIILVLVGYSIESKCCANVPAAYCYFMETVVQNHLYMH